MKKLALASVAFAAVSAFGAGDSFATGVVFTTSNSAIYNDSATWTGGPTLATAGPVTSTTGVTVATSVHSADGVLVTAAFNTTLVPTSPHNVTSLYHDTQANRNITMPSGANLLIGGTTGTLHVSFGRPMTAVGFYVSAEQSYIGLSNFTDFVATVQFYGTSGLLGTDTLTTAIATGCSGMACAFVGASTGATPSITGITSFTVAVGTGAGVNNFTPAISDLQLQYTTQEGVPEPASLTLLGMGLLSLAALRRRRSPGSTGESWRWSPLGRWRVSSMPPDTGVG
jgi:hypothetical protein